LNTAHILKWLEALGSPLVALAVFVATCVFYWWQVRLARQKLRHDLYDRRFAIYVAFRDLLLALPEKGDDEIKLALRRASIARLEAPFVLGDDSEIRAYLDQICREVTDDVVAGIMFCDGLKNSGAMNSDPQAAADFAARASRELPRQFARFLSLTDFSG